MMGMATQPMAQLPLQASWIMVDDAGQPLSEALAQKLLDDIAAKLHITVTEGLCEVPQRSSSQQSQNGVDPMLQVRQQMPLCSSQRGQRCCTHARAAGGEWPGSLVQWAVAGC
jgi:hypothetical protein